jgi:hypothetical protein
MKAVQSIAAMILALATIPAFAAGPAQGPVQGPQQAPTKTGMVGGGAAVATQPGVRRAYSYDPAAPMTAPAVRSYSYQPAAPVYGTSGIVGGSYRNPRITNPLIFTRTESVKSAAFKSVQQYADGQ